MLEMQPAEWKTLKLGNTVYGKYGKRDKRRKFTGRIFSPVVLSGYVPDLLKSISMMSETPELNGGGYCGKGYKEWVKVSDGGPYIKAEIELG